MWFCICAYVDDGAHFSVVDDEVVVDVRVGAFYDVWGVVFLEYSEDPFFGVDDCVVMDLIVCRCCECDCGCAAYETISCDCDIFCFVVCV